MRYTLTLTNNNNNNTYYYYYYYYNVDIFSEGISVYLASIFLPKAFSKILDLKKTYRHCYSYMFLLFITHPSVLFMCFMSQLTVLYECVNGLISFCEVVCGLDVT